MKTGDLVNIGATDRWDEGLPLGNGRTGSLVTARNL